MSEVNSNTSATSATTPATVIINPESQVAKFRDNFQLTSETVGQNIRTKVSTKGAVRVDLLTKKDVGTALNIKGDALEVKMRELGMGLKSEMAAGFSRLSSNPNWAGASMTMSPKGDRITFQLKKLKPLVLTAAPAAKEVDDEALAKALGIPVAELENAKKALKELGIAPATEPTPEPAEGTVGDAQPATNGTVAAPEAE